MRSRRQQRRARLGKALRHFLGDALDARPAGHQRTVATAFRALLGHRQREAAMVAVEPLAEAMLDQPRRALRAFDAVAAGAAQRQRRIAAAVQKQQRLLRLGQRLASSPRPAAAPATCPCPAASRRRSIGVDLRQLDARKSGPAGRRADSGPVRALTWLSIDGVADASTTGNLPRLPRTTAMSRA